MNVIHAQALIIWEKSVVWQLWRGLRSGPQRVQLTLRGGRENEQKEKRLYEKKREEQGEWMDGSGWWKDNAWMYTESEGEIRQRYDNAVIAREEQSANFGVQTVRCVAAE